MFIDEVIIHVRSGKGGNGVVHFRREKFVPFGGPDGGDGGHGGDVIFVVSPILNTLSAFHHQAHYNAQDGRNGARQNMTGRSGEDLLVPVPPGTVVYDSVTNAVLGDLTLPDQRLVIAKGGKGGRGNVHFATSRNQAPRIAENGEPAVELRLRLELKLIADIGIVGVPNAGKSTFLAAVTRARPKIAAYPFTTLEPNLGVAELDEDNSLVLADIPGLIEGAHAGVGLGHDFLRHIQRTRVLIHLLDGMAEDPLLDFIQINSELALFDPDLAKKPVVVALNKADLPDVVERWPKLRAALKTRGFEAYLISAVTGQDVRTVLYKAARLLKDAPAPPDMNAMPVYRAEADPRAFEITQTPEGFRVSGVSIERAASMTSWTYDQSINRFQRILKTLGIETALREAGIQEGDTVLIGDYELEWQD